MPRGTTTGWELAQRTRIRAFRADHYLLLVAEGDLPTSGYDVDIEQNPIRILPPHINLLRRERPGVRPDVVQPYRYGEVVPYPPDQSAVTVHHRNGQDAVEIEECGEDLAPFAAVVADRRNGVSESATREATGMSRNLSVDEAFAVALAQLPPPTSQHADRLTSVVVVETGGLFGGFAAFHHLYVRIQAKFRLTRRLSRAMTSARPFDPGSGGWARPRGVGGGHPGQGAVMPTTPTPETPQPRDIALEQVTPEQVADLEAQSDAEESTEEA